MPTVDAFPLHLADVRFPEGHPQAGETGPVLGFAVVHRDGVLVFDTGVGVGHAEVDRWFRPVRHALAEALRGHGLSIGDVAAVANSHLHFDHCGHNSVFAGKPIYVQRAEHRAAAAPGYSVPEWVDFPDASYELLDGEAEVAPGVRVIPTAGHTPGHQSLVLDAEGGPILLVGQAVYSRDEWEGSSDPARSGEPSAWDRDAYAASVGRLRGLDAAVVLFAHDRRPWVRPGTVMAHSLST